MTLVLDNPSPDISVGRRFRVLIRGHDNAMSRIAALSISYRQGRQIDTVRMCLSSSRGLIV